MSVNGITNNVASYTASETTNKKVAEKRAELASKTEVDKKNTTEDTGVAYEPSKKATDSSSKKVTDYSSIVTNMKSELALKNQQLESLVKNLLGKQANKFSSVSDLFKNLKVDDETAAKAKEEISEDGYWGVEKTSDRLVAMAQALSGGDTSKADLLINSIKKGFKQATKAWGEDLPDICQKTLDSAVKKMEDWRDGKTTASASTDGSKQ